MSNNDYERNNSGPMNNNNNYQNINQQNNNNFNSYQNQQNDLEGYSSNSNIYDSQNDSNGYSNSNGIYDTGTIMYINSCNMNNNYQYKHSLSNNNTQYQNNNSQNSYQNNMNNNSHNNFQYSQQFNSQNSLQFNHQNSQQFNNNQNNNNFNQQQFIQNKHSQDNFNANTQRNNYNNIQQQFMDNSQNIQQNNFNLNTQRNYNPNMNNYNNNSPNCIPISQRSQFDVIPRKCDCQDMNHNGPITQRRFSQHQQVINNNLYQNTQRNFNGQNINNNMNPQNKQMNNQHNNIIPNQHSNIIPNQHSNIMPNQHSNYIPNQHSNFIPNQHINLNPNQYSNNSNGKNSNLPMNISQNSNPNLNQQKNNNSQNSNNIPQDNLVNQQQYSNINMNNNQNSEKNINNLANDIQKNLNIGEKDNNSQNPPKNDSNPIEKNKNQNDLDGLIVMNDDKIKFLEDDVFVSLAESIQIPNDNNNKENNINQDKNPNFISNEPNKESQPNKNEKSQISHSKKGDKDDDFHLLNSINKGNNDCNDNSNPNDLFSLNYTKTIYTDEDDFNLLKKSSEVNNNNNRNEEVQIEKEVPQVDILIRNNENDFEFPGMSVFDSVQISDELPQDIHIHPLSNEKLRKEICLICNKETSCDKGTKCQQCPLIICDQCNFFIRVNSCSHSKHEHPLCLLSQENWQCDVCKKSASNFKNNFYFNCKKCKYNICLSCYNPERKMENEEPLHEHPLESVNDSNSTKCNLCEKKIEKGYICNSCGIQICSTCAEKIYTNRRTNELDVHPLLLILKDNWKCFDCEKSFQFKLSLFCKQCSRDYCFECFEKSC